MIEKSLTGDFSIIKAWKADKRGNLIFRKTARNFNQDMAKAGKYVIAEVEEIVEVGELDPENIHTPCIYVDALVLSTVKHEDKPIEFKTNSKNMGLDKEQLKNPKYAKRVKIASRAAQEIKNNSFLNLGIGMPTMVPLFIPDEYTICM